MMLFEEIHSRDNILHLMHKLHLCLLFSFICMTKIEIIVLGACCDDG